MAFDLPTPSDLARQLAHLQSLTLSEPERAQEELLEVLRLALLIESKPQEAAALLQLAACCFYQGKYREMFEFSQQALEVSREAKVPQQEVKALNHLGLALQRLGELERAMQHFLDSLRLAQQLLDYDGVGRALSNIALVHVVLGEYPTALQLHEQALEIAQSSGQAVYTANLLSSVLGDHFHLQQYDKALNLADEAVMFARSHGLSRYECSTRITLGRILLALHRYEASARVARVGLRVARWAKDRETEARLYWVEGLALLRLGDLEQAAERLHASERLGLGVDYKQQQGETYQALAELYQALGKPEEAAAYAQKAAAVGEAVLGKEITQRTKALAQQFQQTQSHQPQQVLPWSAELFELTRNLKRANTELAYHMAHDPLTGAMNRAYFQMRLQRLLYFLGPEEMLGLVFVGLDQMKTINEVFGQAVGDSVLAEVAQRIRAVLWPGDFLGRLGGDEFVLLLNYLSQPEDIELVMDRVLTSLRKPFLVRAQEVTLTASLSGVVAPQDGTVVEDLFGKADLALQKVKTLGGDRLEVFREELSAEEHQRRTLIFDLRCAESRNELRLHYQPIYSFLGKQLQGFEALVRWQHPRLGLLPPGRFIALAEENRLIVEIGDWVLREACHQAKAWQLEERGLRMAVNISPLQFGQPDFIPSVRAALEANGLSGKALVLELTESMVQHNPDLAHKNLKALHELGLTVALDDFGTGFSSLSILQNMPFEVLKIDRSFLQELKADFPGFERARMLVETMINLAHNMQMKVIAEGVESAEQFGLLGGLGCEQAQGYWLGQPQPASDLALKLGWNFGLGNRK